MTLLNVGRPAQNILFNEFSDFLTQTGVNHLCPACNRGSSSILLDEIGVNVRMLFADYGQITSVGYFSKHPSLAYGSVLTSCDNCGYIRTFSAMKVNEWLNFRDPERINRK